MNFDEVNRSIREICGVVTDLDAQQILDIIVSKDAEGKTGNKFDDYSLITSGWQRNEWVNIVKEFYTSFSNANLARLTFNECCPGANIEARIDDQRNISGYKKAPDNYYLQMVNYEIDRPKEASPLSGDDEKKVLLSAYVALARGDNYSTVGYPPQIFINKVAGLYCSREDYFATIKNAMLNNIAFDKQVMTLGSANRETVMAMNKAYDSLFGSGKTVEVESVAEDSSKSSRGWFKRVVSSILHMFNNDRSKEALSKVSKSFESAFDSANEAATQRAPTLMSKLWFIILVINMMTVALTVVVFVLAMFNTNSVLMTSGVGLKVASIPIVGSLLKATVEGWTRSAYFVINLLRIGVTFVICLFVTFVHRKTLDPKGRGSLFLMIFMLLAFTGTVYNCYFIFRFIYAIVLSFGQEPFFGYLLKNLGGV